MLIKFKKGDNLQITNHFNSSEFECPCNKCTDQFIDDKLVNDLEDLRKQYGSLIRISSGYRCPAHNESVGGVSNSSHCTSLAADIQPVVKTLDELDKLYELAYKKFDNVGDGRNKGFIHVDVRPQRPDGRKRTWVYP